MKFLLDMGKLKIDLLIDQLVLKKVIFLLLLVTFLLPFFFKLNALTATHTQDSPVEAYRVYIDDEEIGTVAGEEFVASVLNYLSDEYDWFKEEAARPHNQAAGLKKQGTRSDTLHLTKKKIGENIFLLHSQFEQNLMNYLSTHYEGWEIRINGRSVAAVESQAEADRLLLDIRNLFVPQSSEKDHIIQVETRLTGDLEITQNLIPKGRILSPEKAKRMLLKGTTEEKRYTVAGGDTVWSISKRYGVSTGDIAKANPGLNIDHIYIGDVLSLIVPKPFLHVETKYRHTYRERIPYKTNVIWDSKLLRTRRIVERGGQHGIKEITADVTLKNGSLQNEKVLDEQLVKQPVTQVLRRGTLRTTEDRLASAILPEDMGLLTSPFGWRGRGFHSGIDYGVSTGTPIHAFSSGKVIFAGFRKRSGGLVILKHSGEIHTHYAHCSTIKVKEGDEVSRGDVIALSGNTGYSTGPHVHFEVHKHGRLIDSLVFLRSRFEETGN